MSVDIQHTADTLIKLNGEIQHSSDSLLSGTYDKSHTSDALLTSIDSQFHSTDTRLKAIIDKSHTTDMSIRPSQRDPILKKLIIGNVPEGINVGSQDVKILSLYGNDTSEDDMLYVLDPQEFVIGLSHENQLNIIDPIIKKPFESTILDDDLEPAGQVPLDNIEFQGFPVFFAPLGSTEEEFIDGWVNYAKMSDDPVEENFEETPDSWNDLSDTSWSKNRINPDDNLDPSLQQFTDGNNPGVPTKSIENSEEWYTSSPASLVQSAGFSKLAGDPATMPVSFDLPISDGSILIIAACTADTFIAGITQSGVTWFNLQTGPSQGANTQIWIGYDVSSADQNLLLHLSSPAFNGSVLILEFSGLDPTAVTIDAADVFTDTNSIISTETAVTARQNGLWLTAVGFRRSDKPASSISQQGSDSPWSLIEEQIGNVAVLSTGTRIILYQKISQGIDKSKFLGFMSSAQATGIITATLKPI